MKTQYGSETTHSKTYELTARLSERLVWEWDWLNSPGMPREIDETAIPGYLVELGRLWALPGATLELKIDVHATKYREYEVDHAEVTTELVSMEAVLNNIPLRDWVFLGIDDARRAENLGRFEDAMWEHLHDLYINEDAADYACNTI